MVVITYYLELEMPVWRRDDMDPPGSNEEGETVVIMDADGNKKVAEFINTKEDKEAKLESEIYFEGESTDGGEGTESSIGKNGNHSWPTRFEDYSPVAKGTVARTLFNDAGEKLLQSDKKYKNLRPRVLSKGERSTGIHVITTFFHGSYEARRFSEIVSALAANLENPYVSFVHTLWEKEDPTQYIAANAPHLLQKLVAVEAKAQPTYAKLFKYANENLDRGAVAIVTNADIYFDSALRCVRGPDPSIPLESITNKQRTVFALSRRHTLLCGKVRADHGSVLDLCQDYVHSHDAFVFAVPVPDQLIKKTNHMQNRYGGENIVIWEFTLLGYRVMNPCKKVHAIHLHCSQERHYTTNFIDGYRGSGPYRHGTVWPGTVRTDTSRRGWKTAGFLACGTRLQ
jgi:hypothetical protein